MPFATEENLTDLAIQQWGACGSPRLRQIMQSLVKHLHGFVRDVDLKQDSGKSCSRS
jgi:hydroxyquinol 1,2-dioxygenase